MVPKQYFLSVRIHGHESNPEECCQFNLVLLWLSFLHEQASPFCKLKGSGEEDVVDPYPIE